MRGSVPADGTRISRNEAEDLQVGGWWKGRVLSRPASAQLSHVHVASKEILKKAPKPLFRQAALSLCKKVHPRVKSHVTSEKREKKRFAGYDNKQTTDEKSERSFLFFCFQRVFGLMLPACCRFVNYRL